jgi:hypothetical protein
VKEAYLGIHYGWVQEKILYKSEKMEYSGKSHTEIFSKTYMDGI